MCPQSGDAAAGLSALVYGVPAPWQVTVLPSPGVPDDRDRGGGRGHALPRHRRRLRLRHPFRGTDPQPGRQVAQLQGVLGGAGATTGLGSPRVCRASAASTAGSGSPGPAAGAGRLPGHPYSRAGAAAGRPAPGGGRRRGAGTGPPGRRRAARWRGPGRRRAPRTAFPGGGAAACRLPGLSAGRFIDDLGDSERVRTRAGGQRTRARTSSRMAVMASWLGASTLRRSRGSVLEGRRLNQQPSPRLTVSPSSRSLVTPGRA